MCLLPFRMRVFELRSTFIFIIGILFIIFCVIFHIFVFELKILLEINEGKKYRIFFFNTLILFRKKLCFSLQYFSCLHFSVTSLLCLQGTKSDATFLWNFTVERLHLICQLNHGSVFQ